MRGRWRQGAGLALLVLAGVIALFGGRSGGGPKLSDDARRYPADERNVFVKQVRLLPVVPVLGPGTQRSQPIWVEDVAEYYAHALDLPAAETALYASSS